MKIISQFLLGLVFWSYLIPQLHSQAIESPDSTAVGILNFRPESQLKGKIQNALTPTLTLHTYRDFITFEGNSYRAKLHDKGEYSFFNTNIEQPTIALLTYNELRLEIYITPDTELALNFDYNDFFETLKFTGIDEAPNNFLVESLRRFHTYDWERINYEMLQRSPMEFRQYIDDLHAKKIAFLEDYTNDSTEVNLPKDFIEYVRSDYDYWRAYHLMRYRSEYPAGKGLPIPMTLPANYYNFLLDIKINNDIAINNKYYSYFLDHFFNFVQEQPTEMKQLESGAIGLVTTDDTYGLVSGPFGVKMLQKLKKNLLLKVLDERLEREDVVAESWYHLETPSGQSIYVNGSYLSIPKVNESTDNQIVNTASRKVTTFKNKASFTGVVTANALPVRAEAHLSQSVANLDKGTHLELFNEFSKDKIEYDSLGTICKENFIKVKYNNNKVGWVRQNGIQINEQVTAQNATKEIPITIAPEIYQTAKKYLSGKALEFVLAKNIYHRSTNADPKKLLKEIDDFVSISEVKLYQEIVKNSYNQAVTAEALKPQTLALHQLEPGANKSYGDLGSLQFELAAMRKNGELSIEDEKRIADKKYATIPHRTDNRTAITTSLAGSMELPVGYEIELVLYTDPIVYRQKRIPITIDSTDLTFSSQFSLIEPTLGELHYGNRSIPVYIEPGDQLNLTFAGIRLERTAKFTGKGGAHNNYLLASQKVFTPLDEEMRNSLRFAEANRFQKYMQLLLADKLDFLNNFNQRNEFTARFKKFATGDINYWYAFYLLNYPWEHPLYKGKKAPMQMPDGYYDFLKETPIVVNDLLPNQYYAYFIQQYIDYQVNRPANKGMNKMEAAKKYLQGEAYYYYKANLLAGACRKGKAQLVGYAMRDFLEKCPFETYNQLLQYTYQKSKGLIKDTPAPHFELVDINGDSISTKDLKGKVVVVDFWATWCAPCIRNISFTQRLKKEFPANEIAFVYISLDEDKTKWQRFVTANKLKGIHLNSDSRKGYRSEIASLFGVTKLPTYFLIDKQGRIAQDPERLLGMNELQKSIHNLINESDTRMGAN